MRCAILGAAGVLAAAGCSNKTQDGLPPATAWQASPGAPAGTPRPDVPPLPPPPTMAGVTRTPSNPHAGMDMGGDPSDPHAGMDMGGDPSDPHAGMDMGGTDVTKLGLAAPDPDRPIDPSHRVAGTITIDAKLKALAKPGTAVFLTVKRAGSDGAPSGSALAVDKLTWSGSDGMPFELTDAQAMVAGTSLSGDVVVIAHYDQDSDALSKQPGDIIGQVRVKVPAEHVKLTLDTALP